MLWGKKKTDGDGVQDNPDEILRFIEQARWLLDFHDRRSESLTSRAVALLGFVGVILALLVGREPPKGLDPTRCMIVTYAGAVGSLILTAAFCIAVLSTREQQMPGAKQLRSNWRAWVTRKRQGRAAKDIAESLLMAKDLTLDAPINSVINAADSRAKYFRIAVIFMALSVAATTLLLVQVGIDVITRG